MKRISAMLLAVVLVLTAFTACGTKKGPAETVDLAAFYNSVAEKQEMPAMMEADDDVLNSYYPGLTDYELSQRIVQMAAMTGVACEIALVQCGSEADAAAVAKIFEARKTAQAEGGAWYPATVEAWGKAKIVQNGEYVALVAMDTDTDAVVEDFNALFK